MLVTWPALTKLEIVPEKGALYVGTMLAHTARGAHDDNSPRGDLKVTWRSSDAAVAAVDRFGNVTALKPGSATISAEAEGVTARQQYTVPANPVTSLETAIKETRSARATSSISRRRRSAPTARRSPTRRSPGATSTRPTTRSPRRADPGIIDAPTDAVRRQPPGPLHAAGAVRQRARAHRDRGQPRDVRSAASPSPAAASSTRPTRRTSGRGPGRTAGTTASSGTWGGDGWAHRLRHHRHEQHREDRLDQGRRPHDQRRDGLARRPVRRALARGRVESRERRGDPRPGEPGASEGRVDVRPGADRRRAQHVRDQRLPVRGLRRRRSTSSST